MSNSPTPPTITDGQPPVASPSTPASTPTQPQPQPQAQSPAAAAGDPEVVEPERQPTPGAYIYVDGHRRAAEYWSDPRRRNPGSQPISRRDAALLDQTALRPVEAPSKPVLKAIHDLGLNPDKWNKMKLRAAQELGRYMSMQVTGRVLLVSGFDSIEQVEHAMGVAREIMDAKDSQGNPASTPENRLLAVRMMAECAKAYKDLSNQIMELAEKSADPATSSAPRKNLPPPVVVQVNTQVAGSSSPDPATANTGPRQQRNLPPPTP